MSEILGWSTAALAAIVVVVAALAWLASRYEKVGPNEVLIVSGRQGTYGDPVTGGTFTRNFRIFHGGGTFVLPIRERADRLPVELMTLELLTPEFFTKFGVPIVVSAIAQIKVRSDDPVATATAAEMFLSKSTAQMNEIAHQMMQGHLRAVISTLPFEEIHANPEAFAQTVHRLTAADLANMGIQVVSFTIRQVQDPSRYLEAIGRPQLAEVEKNAVIGEARAQRDATRGRSEADREGTVAAAQAREAAELARLKAEVAVAEAEKDRDLLVHAHSTEVARARAGSDLAYEVEQAHVRRALATEEAGVLAEQRRGRIAVEQLEIARRELELQHTVVKPAEAEQQSRAMLAAAEAEAIRVRGLAEAEIVRARGKAEADALRERALADAEGVRAHHLAEAEGMQRKAEAWKAYGSAALGELLIDRLPEVAAAVASPLAKIDRITLLQSGQDGAGAAAVTRNVVDVLAQVPAVVETVTGLRLADLVAGLGPVDEPTAP
ncbi:MAG: flotillin family protein [Alphaproteobacteria bacterium]|nr:flotillin family protein [Alphaproteobacteria bacterium]